MHFQCSPLNKQMLLNCKRSDTYLTRSSQDSGGLPSSAVHGRGVARVRLAQRRGGVALSRGGGGAGSFGRNGGRPKPTAVTHVGPRGQAPEEEEGGEGTAMAAGP